MLILTERLTLPGYRGSDRRYPVNDMASFENDVTPKCRRLLQIRREAKDMWLSCVYSRVPIGTVECGFLVMS